MSRVVHFEIHASQPEALIAFYTAMFGWTIRKWEGPMPYWIITTGTPDQPGIDGGLVMRQGPSPANGAPVSSFVCTVNVDDLDAKLSKLPGAGGTLAVPKMPIPGVGWLAYAKDPDGSIFGMMQNDPNAGPQNIPKPI